VHAIHRQYRPGQAWSGFAGVHSATHQDRWDAVNRAANDHLFAAAAIGAHDRVLDIGCGNGLTCSLTARLATRGQVLGVDLSVPMLDCARSSAADAPPFGCAAP
jgi:cyclopropane fatty-acyl-phospholipid synthase-like methyltransferase